MARFTLGLMAGIVIATVAGAALSIHAQGDDVAEAAAAAHVDPIDLAGAVNTTGLSPYAYLYAVGELTRPTLATPPVSGRVACIIRVESHGNPNARNPSGAAGLGQFLPSTWATTPQGRAGMSVYDPVANTAAINYMLQAGRAREFDAVRYFGC
jgi:hypothetical protein